LTPIVGFIYLIHHVVEGVTRPLFGAASAFSGITSMALEVFAVSVLMLNIVSRPRENVFSTVRQNHQIAFLGQIKVDSVITGASCFIPHENFNICFVFDDWSRPPNSLAPTEIRSAIRLHFSLCNQVPESGLFTRMLGVALEP
jgi:hypothetical protein